jgi:disulfide oxidoreductase YuzD
MHFISAQQFPDTDLQKAFANKIKQDQLRGPVVNVSDY